MRTTTEDTEEHGGQRETRTNIEERRKGRLTEGEREAGRARRGRVAGRSRAYGGRIAACGMREWACIIMPHACGAARKIPLPARSGPAPALPRRRPSLPAIPRRRTLHWSLCSSGWAAERWCLPALAVARRDFPVGCRPTRSERKGS